MRPNGKPVLALTAGDLMTETVIAVPKEMSLRGAAHILAQAHVSGAPVTDSLGRCVGVISSSDFVTWADGSKRTTTRATKCVGPICSAWQLVEGDGGPAEETVADYMTADPVTVTVEAPITALCRMMLDAAIHRVVVVDNESRPVGIVSSGDILAAIARPQAAGIAPPHLAGVRALAGHAAR